MVSAFTPNKRIEQPAFNDYVNSWNIPVNADWAILDLALGGSVSVNLTGLSGNQALTSAQYQPLKIIASGAPTANTNLVVPSTVGGLWVVRNNTTGGFAITISSAAGGSVITVPVGTNTLVTCDGSATGMFLAINTSPVAAGLDTQVQFNNAGVLGGATTLTWNGTTLTTNGLNVTGNTVLGDAAGDTLTINGTAASAPNGLNVNTNQFVLAAPPSLQVGIGTATLGSDMLTVAGSIKSTAGGYVFPDGTIQTTAFTATGMVSDFVGSTLPPGWVWANGTTIGNAASNATGRAHATDTLALFTSLWGWANVQAPIVNSNGTAGTRGANAAADFAANKAITVPDLRGRVVAGMDVIGGSANANLLSSVITSTTPGAAGGVQTYALAGAELAAHQHTGVDHLHQMGNHRHGGDGAQAIMMAGPVSAPWSFSGGGPTTFYISGVTGYMENPALTTGGSDRGLTTGVSGSSSAHQNTQPTMVMNKIVKL